MTKEILENLSSAAGFIIARLAEAENKHIVHLTSSDNMNSIVFVRGEDHVKELAKCVEHMVCRKIEEGESKILDKSKEN